MSLRPLAFALALTLGVATSAAAQEGKVKPAEADSMAAAMDFMTPMMGKMAAAMLSGVLDLLSDPATVDKLATFNRRYFDALLGKGFTREEALRIVMAVGVPMMPGQG
jgi:hypothetical protein